MITNDELLLIMERISDTTATEEEIFKFNTWCDSFKGTEKDIPNLEEIQARVLIRVHGNIGNRSKVFPLYVKRIFVAAAAIAAITLCVWFYTSRPVNNFHSEIASMAHDIAPGKNTAMLTLANGKTITLSDAKTGVLVGNAKLTYNDGTAIGTSGNGELDPAQSRVQTISTPRGGTYQITLSDGTKVWLNAASSLTYAADLNDKGKRKVKLEGEGYFEVAKDKKHPFLVESKGQQVEVLGTHFNVCSYADNEGTKTTLLEGSVKVKAAKTFAVLKPNHQALLTNQSIKITEIDAKEAIAWKDGYFRFNDTSIKSVMLELSRWYNVEVVYQGEITSDGFNGKISRFKNISDVLKMLENTDLVHFKVEGRRVIVLR